MLPVFGGAYSEQAFLNRLGAAGWRTESRAVAVCEVYSFAGWLAAAPRAGALHVRQVTPQHIDAYRRHLLGHDLSVSTTRLALVCLRLYYDFLTEEDEDPRPTPHAASRCPTATCPRPAPTPRPRSPPSSATSPTRPGRRGKPVTPRAG